MPQRPPGFLSPRLTPDVVTMICTAGHVDHGKTRLVKLLTGCNTDRLKEEQERGLTIDLGFAPCFLGNNLAAGIVDVPGHEKFIKNMVAGVSGIDLTILVIAADDGIMPQTIEHVQIMELLGVRRGLVALTKTDLVSPERVRSLTEEIRAFLQNTFLANCPICPVSSETFEGYDAFYETLVAEIQRLERRRSAGIFRMPVERVFTQKGFGAVVTGIPLDGTVAVGDELELVPGGQIGKVKGIQRFLRDAREGGCGQCLALNIPDFGKSPPVRGQVLCAPGYLKASAVFHVALQSIAGLAKPLRNAEEIKFHTGTAEESGKVLLLDSEALADNQRAFATVLLHRPVAAAVGDRFIVRRASPAMTIAGGQILEVGRADQRLRKSETLERLQRREAFFQGYDPTSDAGAARKLEYLLLHVHPLGCTLRDLSRSAMLPLAAVRTAVGRLQDGNKILLLAEDYYIHREAYDSCLQRVRSRIETASREGGVLNLTISELHRDFDFPSAVWKKLESDLERSGLLERRGDTFVLPTSVTAMSEADRNLIERILALYEKTGFQSPRPDELPALLQTTQPSIDRLLNYLCKEGRLLRLTPHVILTRAAFKKAQDMVVATIQEKGVLNSADFKYHIASSRKYALAILDYLDARRVTVRVGNDRKLAPDFRRNLLE
ncbi:MAG: selenocysteine-specific translation elongation factor [Candidatus Sumerlaeia bacterium]|nr:selenocysteine-specific translation elongation factor [Candidatus Sumerlaeia bacterium]